MTNILAWVFVVVFFTPNLNCAEEKKTHHTTSSHHSTRTRTDHNKIKNKLFAAIQYPGRHQELCVLLQMCKINVNAPEFLDKTLLHHAQYPQAIETLIQHGANPNTADLSGNTPLTYLLNNSLENPLPENDIPFLRQRIQSLILHGANVELTNAAGKSALLLAVLFDIKYASRKNGYLLPLIKQWVAEYKKLQKAKQRPPGNQRVEAALKLLAAAAIGK